MKAARLTPALLTLALPLLTSTAATRALAQSAPLGAPDQPPVAVDPPSAWKLGLAQVGSSMAVAAGVTVAAWAVSSAFGSGNLTTLVAATAPIAAALTVCKVGLTSRHYESNCGPAVGLSLATFPVVLTMIFSYADDDPANNVPESAIGAAWLLLPPLLATATWHFYKRPRTPRLTSQPLPAAAPPRPIAVYQLRRRSTVTPGEMLVPLIATTF